MKKVLLSAISLAALSGSAFAADLPSRKEAVLPPPPPMWTGFYAGLNIGGNIGVNNQSNSSLWQTGSGVYNESEPLSSAIFGGTVNNNQSMTQSGVIGGAQIGYNYQLGPNFVVGLEADFQGTGMRGYSNGVGLSGANSLSLIDTYDPAEYFTQNGAGTQSISAGVNWLGTVRGRVGYLWTPTFLTYATSGLTYGGVYAKVSHTSAQNIAIANEDGGTCCDWAGQQLFYGNSNSTQTLIGWNIGGGAEWMFMPGWSIKAEALYWNLGNMNVRNVSYGAGAALNGSEAPSESAMVNPALIAGHTSVNYQGVIARAGVNYHFNFAAAPVVAKF